LRRGAEEPQAEEALETTNEKQPVPARIQRQPATEAPPPPTPEPPPPAVVIEGEAAPEAAVETTEPNIIRPWPADRFGYGIQVHGNATVGDPVYTMDTIQSSWG
jgi:hypothetical protein